MSGTYDKFEKEIIDSLWQAGRLIGYTLAYAFAGKKVLGITRPSAKMDISDAGKLGGYVTLAVITDDYALKKGWYKDQISK